MKVIHAHWYITRQPPEWNWELVEPTQVLSPNRRNNRPDQRKAKKKKAKVGSKNDWTSVQIPSQFEQDISSYAPCLINKDAIAISDGDAIHNQHNWIEVDEQDDRKIFDHCTVEAPEVIQELDSPYRSKITSTIQTLIFKLSMMKPIEAKKQLNCLSKTDGDVLMIKSAKRKRQI